MKTSFKLFVATIFTLIPAVLLVLMFAYHPSMRWFGFFTAYPIVLVIGLICAILSYREADRMGASKSFPGSLIIIAIITLLMALWAVVIAFAGAF